MRKTLVLITLSLFVFNVAKAQPCTPQGNETSYGTNNVWLGYVYDNANFTGYTGYVTEGTSSNPNFDESFGGSNTTYATNGCSIQTETFSTRYKLTKTFTNGTYNLVVGGDDGYRLSLDGGNTWVIDQWHDQSYSTTSYSAILNGSYNLILEFYENSGDNRVSFSVSGPCATENTSIYGTGDVWNAYVYDGTNFNAYVGMVHEGNVTSSFFNENFGGSNTNFATSGCDVQTETFSVRFRLTKTFINGSYTFFVGGDDGYRLSLDGGATWIIDRWVDQSYNVSSATITLNGTYNMVLEFYENGGDNAVSFTYQVGSVLAVKLISFNGIEKNRSAELNWDVTTSSDPDYFVVERSIDATNFITAGIVKNIAGENNGSSISYRFTDGSTPAGKSFYRLKMVDLNGTITYSNIVSINTALGKNNSIHVFPSVVTGSTLNIRPGYTLKNVTINIIDLSGKLVSVHTAGSIAAGQTFSLHTNIKEGSKGIYIVRIMDNFKEVSTQKILVQ